MNIEGVSPTCFGTSAASSGWKTTVLKLTAIDNLFFYQVPQPVVAALLLSIVYKRYNLYRIKKKNLWLKYDYNSYYKIKHDTCKVKQLLLRLVVEISCGGETWGKERPLGRPRRRWKDNIKMDLHDVGCGGMEWIELAKDRDRWRALMNAVMNLLDP